MRITPEQVRAARELLDGMHQQELAKLSNLGLSTVRDFETSRREISDKALSAIRSALEDAGIRFIGESDKRGVGVQLSKPAGRK